MLDILNLFPIVIRAPHRESLQPGHGPDSPGGLASRATIIVWELHWVNGIAENIPLWRITDKKLDDYMNTL